MSDFGQPPGGWGQPPQQPPPGGWGQPPQQQPGFQPPPYGAPGFAPMQQQSASGMAIAALILGILSFAGCGPPVALVGLILGKIEMNKIKRGESPVAGETLAKAGFFVSIANLVLYGGIICIYLVFVVVFAGVAATGNVR